jgi:hypothetical protein
MYKVLQSLHCESYENCFRYELDTHFRKTDERHKEQRVRRVRKGRMFSLSANVRILRSPPSLLLSVIHQRNS